MRRCKIARQAGVKVMETKTNVGKAGALEDAIRRFKLIKRFPVVMLLDADTRVQPGYFDAALPLFENPEVVAVAGCVKTARGRALTLTGKCWWGTGSGSMPSGSGCSSSVRPGCMRTRPRSCPASPACTAARCCRVSI